MKVAGGREGGDVTRGGHGGGGGGIGASFWFAIITAVYRGGTCPECARMTYCVQQSVEEISAIAANVQYAVTGS